MDVGDAMLGGGGVGGTISVPADVAGLADRWGPPAWGSPDAMVAVLKLLENANAQLGRLSAS
jgi:hypothetical protein